jgi:hypothetical protein
MTATSITCPNCGEKRDTSGRYTSPANQARARAQWAEEHESGRCLRPTPIDVPIVQIGGWLTSGKDAYADRLVAEHGFRKLAMGELILDFQKIEQPWVRVRIRDTIALLRTGKPWVRPGFHRLNSLVDRLGYVTAKTIPDFRQLMQRLGDAARTIIGTRVWVDAMARRLDELASQDARIVYTGCRFPDELELFRSRGATSVWIDRPGVTVSPDADITELALTRDDFDEVVDNDGALEDLWAKADAFAARIQVPLAAQSDTTSRR